MEDRVEVCSLSRQMMFQSVFTPLQGDLRFFHIPLPAASTACFTAHLPKSATLRAYPVPHGFPLFTRSGLEEAAAGYDLGRVVRALDSVNAIVKREPGKNQAQKRLPEGGKDRFYWINPEVLPRTD